MAFLEKLNKMAKNIEDKTGDALEISKHTAQKAKEEAAHREDLRKIGKFYYDFYLAGGQIEAGIMEVMESAKAHADAVAQAQAAIDGIRDENALEKAEKLAAKEAQAEAAAEEAVQEAAEETENITEEPVAQEAEPPQPEAETAQPQPEEIGQPVPTERICSVCGNRVEAGIKFCGECGNKMEV